MCWPMFPKKKKTNPLLKVQRLPGQSLRDEKDRLLEDRLMPYVWIPSFFWFQFTLDRSYMAWVTLYMESQSRQITRMAPSA